jgi:hypothetical protein
MKRGLFSEKELAYLESIIHSHFDPFPFSSSKDQNQFVWRLRRKLRDDATEYLVNHLREWLLLTHSRSSLGDIPVDLKLDNLLIGQIGENTGTILNFLHSWIPPDKNEEFLYNLLSYEESCQFDKVGPVNANPPDPISNLRAFERHLDDVRFLDKEVERRRIRALGEIHLLNELMEDCESFVQYGYKRKSEADLGQDGVSVIDHDFLLVVNCIPEGLKDEYLWMMKREKFYSQWAVPLINRSSIEEDDPFEPASDMIGIQWHWPSFILSELALASSDAQVKDKKTPLFSSEFFTKRAEELTNELLRGSRLGKSEKEIEHARDVILHKIRRYTTRTEYGGGQSGHFTRCINSLKEMGLIETWGKRFRITEKGKKMARLPGIDMGLNSCFCCFSYRLAKEYIEQEKARGNTNENKVIAADYLSRAIAPKLGSGFEIVGLRSQDWEP